MDGKSQTMDAIFDCRVTPPEPQKIYFGLAKGKWKKRYYNNKKSFSYKRYSLETTLSSYVWHLKKTLDVIPNLKWSVVRCATCYSNISKKCLLCLYEKLVIITYPRQHELLNKRPELFYKCSHWRENFNWFNESWFVKPSHKKIYLPDNCVSMKLRVVNN